MPMKKTLVDRSTFQGYKFSTGVYEQFLFSFAESNLGDQDEFDLQHNQGEKSNGKVEKHFESQHPSNIKHKGKKCSIIVEFYKTEKFFRKEHSKSKGHNKRKF